MEPWDTESSVCTGVTYEVLEAQALNGNSYVINNNFTNDGVGIFNEETGKIEFILKD